jgi:pimeloyl-ACP methyl ester carboxylesterase
VQDVVSLWPFRRKVAVAPAPLSLETLRKELEELPQDPVGREHPRNWLFRIKRTADFIGHARPHWARFFRKINPYPTPFRHETFRTEDGVTIAAWRGPAHPGVRPHWGLVIVPGMFSTKDDTSHKRRAIRIWRHWKIPVLCLDMRAFGESTGIATAGWKEALDVHAAVRHLAEREGLSRIAVLAESMGGAAALNALAHDSQTGADLMSGGVLCFSAFVDARDAVEYISARPPEDDPFAVPWSGFRRLLRVKSMGAYERFDEFLDDVARVNGLSGLDELLDLANPKWKVGMMRQPTLLVHAADDPVVPVRHARRMERYAREQAHIQALVTTWGTHTAFEAMDPWWYWEVVRRFFGHVNGVDLPNLHLARRRTDEPAETGGQAELPTDAAEVQQAA